MGRRKRSSQGPLQRPISEALYAGTGLAATLAPVSGGSPQSALSPSGPMEGEIHWGKGGVGSHKPLLLVLTFWPVCLQLRLPYFTARFRPPSLRSFLSLFPLSPSLTLTPSLVLSCCLDDCHSLSFRLFHDARQHIGHRGPDLARLHSLSPSSFTLSLAQHRTSPRSPLSPRYININSCISLLDCAVKQLLQFPLLFVPKNRLVDSFYAPKLVCRSLV